MDHAAPRAKAVTETLTRYVYTYPFKGAYRPLPATSLAIDDWRNSAGSLNVYVHVPFCDVKCGFCHLFTSTKPSPESVESYADAVRREIALVAHDGRFSNYHVDSAYFGGGTPTVMSPAKIDGLVGELKSRLSLGATCELAIESAPVHISPSGMKQLRATGFRRISFGVQSFIDQELADMGRHHTTTDAFRSIDDAHAAGFHNVNVDLIYGLSRQTLRTWEQSLSAAVSHDPETITVYPLAFRQHTAFGKAFRINNEAFPSPAKRSELYELARDFLQMHGYKQLTMVAFAREKGGNRHDYNEFLGIPTVGFGAGALSYGPNYHYTSGHYHDRTPNTTAISTYVASVMNGAIPIQAGIYLDDDEHMRRYLIMRLLSMGVKSADFEARFGFDPAARFGDALRFLRECELIEIDRALIRLTPAGIRCSSLVADTLASDRVSSAAASYG